MCRDLFLLTIYSPIISQHSSVNLSVKNFTMASATEQQQQTTLEFYQAMADFKNMFPQMDDDVIEVKILNLDILIVLLYH